MADLSRAWVWVKRSIRGVGVPWVPVTLVALVVAGQLLAPWTARAEEKRTFEYPYDWVYKAAIRLLKIDLERPIEEADKDTGYILFTYEYQGVKSSASLELMDLTSDENGYSVNTRVKMKKLPSWVEQDLLDQLEAKLEDEYGSPPPFKKKQQAPVPDEDEDGEDQEKDGDDQD